MSTFGLSFVGSFVLFRSVLYWRFHCNHLICVIFEELFIIACPIDVHDGWFSRRELETAVW